jgi:hypothetical protein
MTANLMTEAEYARHRGVHRSTVLLWKRKGLLVRGGERIHVAASDAILDGRPGSYRGGKTSARSTNGAAPPDEQPVVDLDNAMSWTLSEAQRRKEIALALTRELMLAKAKGEVVLLSDVQPAWARIVLGVRSAMLGIPSRLRLLMPQLSVADIEKIREIIRDALVSAALTDEPPAIED